MSEQENRLVTRWDGHEVKLKALIPIIRDNSEWHETDQYKELISAVGVPEPFGEVERDLRGANFQEANLEGPNLRGANLRGANLQKAYLVGANLQEAVLESANLQEADLGDANLKGAILFRSILREAIFQDADLSQVKGLLGGQLAGVVVSGAKLPDDIKTFEGLAIVKEASQNARKLFFGMLAGCAYTVLTIATTTDARLLTNSSSSPLPIIGTPIPIVSFYWAAPLLLLAFYLYFHLYMQRLWEGLARLPSVFPDGRSLDERAYPWILIGYIRAHILRLRKDRPHLSRLQVFLSIILAWWVVPITIFLLWGRYLSRHNWPGTVFHVAMLGLAVGAGFALQRLARKTLRGEEKRPFYFKRILKDVRTYKITGVVIGCIGVVIIFLLLSRGFIEGKPSGFPVMGANLTSEDVSIKPSNWTGKKEEELDLVKGARLQGMDLRKAKAGGVFLAKAVLWDADLQGAYLHNADLRGADLRGANLEGAFLWLADLRGANLQFANLGAANLEGADLGGANLQSADFQGASLREARDLDIDQLSQVKTLCNTRLDPGLMEQVKEKYPHLLEKPKDEE